MTMKEESALVRKQWHKEVEEMRRSAGEKEERLSTSLHQAELQYGQRNVAFHASLFTFSLTRRNALLDEQVLTSEVIVNNILSIKCQNCIVG